ncbi:MAG: GWxTD domain-containing protein [Ignavibacteriales bacterium]|nr:GWxTD domain-containing protein [Ignavibacteriales bacterium]
MKRVMLYNLLKLILIFFLNSSIKGFNISRDDGSKELYNKGIEAIKFKDTLNAEKYFKESIRENSDAASYFELAKIYLNHNTFYTRNLAFENSQMAVWKESRNLEYIYLYASIAKDFARFTAIDQYKKIIEIDSNQVDAWFNLAMIKEDDFLEYNKSVRNVDGFISPLQEYADEDFNEAEKYYLNALKLDSVNYQTILKLSLMYDKGNKPEKGIPLLQRLIKINKADKEIHLALGLLYYKTSKLKECFTEYQKAIELMPKEEREDFTFNSVKSLLLPAYDYIMKEMSDYELKDFIDLYWKVSDPLYITDYNERLLEHYSRVAYANLNFSVPSMNIVGWKSNQGEVILRYGEPLNRTRIRPSLGDKVNMKTEVWDYSGFTLGFTDMAQSGNFIFAAPAGEKDKTAPQFAGDTQTFMNDLRSEYFTHYEPKYEGPKFDIVYDFLQFKSGELRNHTDLYIDYGLNPIDSLVNNGILNVEHDAAFFFFNNNSEEQIKKKEHIRSLGSRNIVSTITHPILYTNTLHVPAITDSGYYSLEILRNVDKGVSSNRGRIEIKKFSNIHLDISDIILASRVETGSQSKYSINRNKINILSNLTKQFMRGAPLYIYYEVYNLKKNESGLTDFEQEVEVKEYSEENRSGLEKTISDIGKFFGFGKGEGISFSSKYQSAEVNPQIHYQLDLSKAKTGKYLITITVTDKIDNSKVSSQTVVDWTN